MENNEIIIIEFSQEQQLFHFKFEDEKPVLFSKWHTIGKIEINKAIEFCKMIDKKYYKKCLTVGIIRIVFKEFQR